MKNNENQFKGIPPSVIFTPYSYRFYIDSVKKLYLLNVLAVENYLNLKDFSFDEGMEIYRRLQRFRLLCSELMNVNCEHGFYKPDALDIRRLLGWQESVYLLSKKLSMKVTEIDDEF